MSQGLRNDIKVMTDERFMILPKLLVCVLHFMWFILQKLKMPVRLIPYMFADDENIYKP